MDQVKSGKVSVSVVDATKYLNVYTINGRAQSTAEFKFKVSMEHLWNMAGTVWIA